MKKSHSQKPHDSAYKYLFRNKKIFLQLLKSFVDEDFVRDIEQEDIESVDKSFVTEDFLDRESDLIYKINLGDKEIIVYILLEFQSKPDKSIPIRLFLYILSLYDLIYRNSQKGQLPNIFPIILYNGNDDWNIPTNISGLIDRNIPGKYIPSYEYYLLSEKDVPLEKLNRLHNLVSAVFLLERQNDEAGLSDAINKIVDFIRDEDMVNIKMFLNWVSKMFKNQLNEKSIEVISEIKEAKSMLTLLAEKIEQRGIEKGVEEGMEKGELLNQRNTLIRQLQKKFGLTDNEIEMIKSCTDTEKLDDALDEILFASDKMSVLGLLK